MKDIISWLTKRALSGIVTGIFILIGIVGAVYAAVNFPGATPGGETTGGKFTEYFMKMMTKSDTSTFNRQTMSLEALGERIGGDGGGGGEGCNAGGPCGGGIFIGINHGHSIIMTPPGCTDSATPTCDYYGTDTVKKTWNNGSTNWTQTNQTSEKDGYTNTMNLVASTDAGSPYNAAKYCADMVYGGHNDWYLPSREEMNLAYAGTFDASNSSYKYLDLGIAGQHFQSDGVRYVSDPYWLSTEMIGQPGFTVPLHGYAEVTSQLGNAAVGGGAELKNASKLVRCVRKM